MTPHIIKGCARDETGGLVLEYFTPTDDVRTNGMVINHALLIPAEDDYLVLIDRVEEVLQQTLADALASFSQSHGIEVVEDDDASPYDNPEER